MSGPDELALRVEGLSKRFELGARAPYRTLRESLARFRPGARREAAGPSPVVWALRDVHFEVARGEAVGIIGANGAGKTTLLKVLSRITEPTAGRAEIHGRVGSLLEVGTGFHPELTGRENVYLNGVLLGMKRAEIRARFDEIVAFSGVERFLDTPVKRYSSGMRVRLAFSVAAHLEPEILIIDEVLAVGDAAFQRRCLGKMSDVAGAGRTVLFVSHNMHAIRRLCSRCIWLDAGRVAAAGPTEDVIRAYLGSTHRVDSASGIQAALAALPEDPDFRLRGVEVRQQGRATTLVGNGEPVEIEIRFQVLEPTRGLRVYLDVCDADDALLIRSFHDGDADAVAVTEPGIYTAIATIPPDLLAPRDYTFIVRASIYDVRPLTGPGLRVGVRVEPTSRQNRAYPSDPIRAKLQPFVPWTTKRCEAP